MSFPNPQGHNWTRKAEEEEEDPLDQMISRSGCAAFHSVLQECMSEHRDWRKCQQHVQRFKACMQERQEKRTQELRKRQEEERAGN
ncbi:cytochrome c oxidase assembly factor 4 homolog, mitochondrial [Rhinatrema bivittatum]|uniref:cytochrome c oxidase assembly factor 4 homolog, mitochondrial n=1 Tax=Rhinatrema bivittatum TaxID=194408 RepID=UPI001125E6DE|nr:cytochrome c oxidase assembly factor 4 homolog, mitochondrial [Rhinatrema bivittatum]XP_029457977.1 cytochrome c oxidase assembly factor 4 homolog, mitochondrial [Rhinatrema bivittatum]